MHTIDCRRGSRQNSGTRNPEIQKPNLLPVKGYGSERNYCSTDLARFPKMATYTSAYTRALRSNPGKRMPRFPVRPERILLRRVLSSDARTLPKLVQPSIWHSIIPRFLRSRPSQASESGQKKARNPATYFIWIYLLIGSQAIRILQVQNEFNTFMRRAELRIGKLREVVEALRRGEEIDVEKALGTGDEAQEREWEEALKEIEAEDRLWQSNRQKRKEERAKASEEAAQGDNQDTASPVNFAFNQLPGVVDEASLGREGGPRPPGFY